MSCKYRMINFFLMIGFMFAFLPEQFFTFLSEHENLKDMTRSKRLEKLKSIQHWLNNEIAKLQDINDNDSSDSDNTPLSKVKAEAPKDSEVLNKIKALEQKTNKYKAKVDEIIHKVTDMKLRLNLRVNVREDLMKLKSDTSSLRTEIRKYYMASQKQHDEYKKSEKESLVSKPVNSMYKNKLKALYLVGSDLDEQMIKLDGMFYMPFNKENSVRPDPLQI